MSYDPNERTMPDTPPVGYPPPVFNAPPGSTPPPPYYQTPPPPPPRGRSPMSMFLIVVLVILCCLTTIVASGAAYLLLGSSTTTGGPPAVALTAAIQPTADQPDAQQPTEPADEAEPAESEPTAQSTATPRPTASTTPTRTPAADCGARASRLEPGDEARVVVFQVSIRDQPGTDQTRTNVAAEGAILRVIEGPTCHQDGTWWYVQTEQGDFGWVLEGDAENYYLEPQ